MFKSRIAIKLSLNFAIALLVFAIIIGGIFITLFKNHTLSIHKTDLENRALKIADTLSTYLDKDGVGLIGLGGYLRTIDDIAGTDVWIVGNRRNLITAGKGKNKIPKNYAYEDLPPNANILIEEVFTGKSAFSEDFSDVLSELTLTVGVPIKNDNGNIVGVVLLHSPVNGISEASKQGITILIISITLALVVSFLLSVVFSISFTKPLAIMKQTSMHLADGNYTVKTNIKQKDEIGDLARTLDILSERLEEASHESAKLEKMRIDFLANISHELKTPVTVITGSLEALVDKVVTDPKKVEEYLSQMLKQSKSLQRLIGDLLDLSRLQSMDFAINKTVFPIYDILDDVTRSANHLAKTKEVTITVTKNSSNYVIVGDYGRIHQMLMIIIDNAIKFSLYNGEIDITVEDNKLYIKDNGIGIQKEDLPYIFDRFYKTQSQQNKTGTGLGLAIAKQIAKRHDIELKVNSIEGKGTTFIFNFPNNSSTQKNET